ncbi:MAG TPA: MATE family efflux transporter [Candidatus Cloacimonadota bacterium]|nr:MATE family efflux transporter [Candidatus Cloacimonadales bacterium]HOE90716.1 MATE family efflux transporter [Candidatus Cloacimonadota bacterium]HOQ80065.1 MATE family efflux transporter [Candidatus Cloacimonadota bacterium]
MNLIQGSVPRHFVKYLIPSIASMLGLSLYILVDTMFIGRGIGIDGLTALNISLPVFSAFLCLGHLLNMGGSTAYAVSIGRQDKRQAQEIFTLCLIMAIIFGFLFTSITIYFLDEICLFLGASESILGMVKDYTRVLILFSSVFIVNSVFFGFIRNDHSPRLCMVAGLTGNIINIILDYIFIFKFGWGMLGAVYATVISPICSILIMSTHFLKEDNNLKIVFPTMVMQKLTRVFKNGLPSMLDSIAPGVIVYFFNITLLKLSGNGGVAAYSVIANIAFVGNVLFMGTAQAMQPISSQNYGAEKHVRVKKAFKLAITTALIFGFLKSIVILSFPESIVKAFNSESLDFIKVASKGLMIYYSAMPFVALNIVSVIFLQSVEKSFSAIFISLSRTIVLILLGLAIFPRFFGVTGVWMIVPFAEVITMIIAISYIHYSRILSTK